MESAAGQGRAFRFTVLVQPAVRSETVHHTEQPEVLGVPVLIVDDNASNRRILTKSLSAWGMRPLVADIGKAALRLIDESSDLIPLILTDFHMPDIDGIALAAAIKQRTKAAMIVMLTSGSQTDDIARCRELGIAAYLTKPVPRNELRREAPPSSGAKRSDH